MEDKQEDNKEEQINAVTEQTDDTLQMVNPMLMVKSKDMPTKVGFALDQNKDKSKGE